MKLRDHINNAYNGNASAFARNHGTTKQQVQRWLDYGCIWLNGQVWKQQSKFVSIEATKDIKQ